MKRLVTPLVTVAAALSFSIALPAGQAVAQERQQVSFKVGAANATFPFQQAIDVEDVPNHQVRVYELHRTFPSNPPVINGVKLKETWTRGYSDYIDNSGPNGSYTVYIFENGDRAYSRANTVSQGSASGRLSFVSFSTFTGGTGKLAGIRGVIRSSGTSDIKAGINETNFDIEYWIDK
jgi:hypothetical protein